MRQSELALKPPKPGHIPFFAALMRAAPLPEFIFKSEDQVFVLAHAEKTHPGCLSDSVGDKEPIVFLKRCRQFLQKRAAVCMFNRDGAARQQTTKKRAAPLCLWRQKLRHREFLFTDNVLCPAWPDVTDADGGCRTDQRVH